MSVSTCSDHRTPCTNFCEAVAEFPDSPSGRCGVRAIIRLHRMHEMQPIVADVSGVCPSVSLSGGSTRLHCAKTAERIKLLFGVNTLWRPRDIVLHVDPDPPTDTGRAYF